MYTREDIGSVGSLGLPIFIIGRAMQSQVSKKWWMSSSMEYLSEPNA
jgi:hypothetical protein